MNDQILTSTDMEEVVHNDLCLWSVMSCRQEHSLEEVCDGLQLMWVELILQHSLVYEITNDGATVAMAIGVH